MNLKTSIKLFSPVGYNIFKSINQKIHVGKILCDLANDFDCMNHEILLVQLHLYGIRGVSEGRFRSCLTNSRQRVEIKSPNKAQLFL